MWSLGATWYLQSPQRLLTFEVTHERKSNGKKSFFFLLYLVIFIFFYITFRILIDPLYKLDAEVTRTPAVFFPELQRKGVARQKRKRFRA